MEKATVAESKDGPVQIFMSYARDDDDLPPDTPPNAKGFVSALHAHLEFAFKRRGYPRPIVWWDKRDVEDGQEFDPIIEKAIDDSSLLLVILSGNWPHRPYCLKELDRFRERWREDRDNVRHRIVIARKNYVEDTEHPRLFDSKAGLLPRQVGYNFFEIVGRRQAGQEREYFDPHKQPQNSEFVQKASELGRYLWLAAAEPRHEIIKRPIGDQPPPRRRKIYLARPAEDMLEAHQRIAKELCAWGFDVAPKENEEIPLNASAIPFIDKALDAAEASVHLLGDDPGFAPAKTEPIVRLQLLRAAEQVNKRSNGQDGAPNPFHRIIWAPKFLEKGPSAPDASERDHGAVLAEFGGDQKTGFDGHVERDEVDGSSVSLFVDFLRDHLCRPGTAPKPLSKVPTGNTKVYLYHWEEDADYATELAEQLQKLSEPQIQLLFPAFEGSPAAVKDWHLKNLAKCDVVVLCWAGSPHVRILAGSDELSDWEQLGRAQQFVFRGLIAGPPPSDRKKNLLRVPPNNVIDKVLDLTASARPIPEVLEEWFRGVTPNDP